MFYKISGFFGRNCLKRCKCLDYCHPKTGSCICKAGYMGDDCKMVCPEGLFGVGCAEKCSCNSYMICDRVTGQCSCAAGLFGEKCEKKCDHGFFGKDCREKYSKKYLIYIISYLLSTIILNTTY